MSQLRLNPLTGRWVTIVSDRAERPSDFAPRVAQVESDPERPCPFCPGHEEERPAALETVGANGEWQARVVPNKYPAFVGDEPFSVRTLGPVHTQAEASGIHEVFVYAREHEASLASLSDDQVASVMSILRKRMQDHAASPGIRYTQAIVNHGRESGASLAHPHGQLLGMPFVPGEILDEERAFGRFHGGCILCATVESELADGSRVVVADDWGFSKTKDAVAALKSLGIDGTVLVVVGRDEDAAAKAFRNLPNVQLVLQDELNAYDVLCNEYIVFSKKTLPTASATSSTGAAS